MFQFSALATATYVFSYSQFGNPGIIACLRVPTNISSTISATAITIISAEFVNEISFPPISIGISSLISNCSSGLCFSPPCVSVANG